MNRSLRKEKSHKAHRAYLVRLGTDSMIRGLSSGIPTQAKPELEWGARRA